MRHLLLGALRASLFLQKKISTISSEEIIRHRQVVRKEACVPHYCFRKNEYFFSLMVRNEACGLHYFFKKKKLSIFF